MNDRRTVSCQGLGLLLAAAILAGPAAAQEPPSSPDVPPSASPSAPKAEAESKGERATNAAFMRPLGRLSSILGSVHFLRKLCGDENAGIWRQKMNELIDAQAPNEADRKILIASFNGGYRAFESTYRKCTPAARLAVSRYQKEGATLSREIGARYGN